jgi:eukaryotic-like serine/threonine-protein kinase
VGLEMVEIPPGSFCMGSAYGEADEKPVHQVTIRQRFYMAKYEVTQAQWEAVMGSNPSHFKGNKSWPVEFVDWNDAQEFMDKMNALNDGYWYRLPSESEWEYACRAGTTGDYYARDVDDIGWTTNNSHKKTHTVGSKRPNAFGLYDMSGNVYEWCLDRFHGDYVGAPADGSAWESGGDQEVRVTRGGSWFNDPVYAHSASRHRIDVFFNNVGTGFRVVAVERAG